MEKKRNNKIEKDECILSHGGAIGAYSLWPPIISHFAIFVGPPINDPFAFLLLLVMDPIFSNFISLTFYYKTYI